MRARLGELRAEIDAIKPAIRTAQVGMTDISNHMNGVEEENGGGKKRRLSPSESPDREEKEGQGKSLNEQESVHPFGFVGRRALLPGM